MDCFAIFRGRRTVQVLLLALTAAFAATARAETFLTVSDVPVDVTAKDAAAARDQAIAVAQSKAWDKLVKEIVTDPAQQVRLHPSQQDIEGFVQDFGVENERVSTVRYIGLYDVRFRESRVRKYLSDSGVTGIGDMTALEQAGGAASGPDQAPSQTQTPTGAVTPYPIAVSVVGLEGWVRLHNQLAGMPGVQRVTLDALTREAAALTLDFGGDLVALQVALSNTGYVLAQTAPGDAAGPGMFQLRPAGAAPLRERFAAPPPPPQ